MLRCGLTLLWEKWVARLQPNSVFFFCRPELAATLAERTNYPVNQSVEWANADVWIIDARWLIPPKSNFKSHELSNYTAMRCAGRIVGLRIDAGRYKIPSSLVQWLQSHGAGNFPEVDLVPAEVPGTVVNHLWDIVDRNPEQINVDYDILTSSGFGQRIAGSRGEDVSWIQPENVLCGAGVQVAPQVVLDARGGPIILGANVKIEPHTYIEGPAAIGEDAAIFGGKIRAGTTIGPGCRVSGEVEASVFLGWANKHHDGFLGHSVIGEWVNLGAMTTNSDLKNNYSPVKVVFPERTIDSGRIKVGSFLADHTKTGIGTLIPTGGAVGFAGNIFGGGAVIPKYIPEFVWGGGKTYNEYQPDKAKQTAEAVVARRGMTFTKAQAQLFDHIFEQTKKQRARFFEQV